MSGSDAEQSSDQRLRVVTADGVATATLVGGSARHTLDVQVLNDLVDLSAALTGSADVRVLVFRGGDGSIFIGGTDIGTFAGDQSTEQRLAYDRLVARALAALRDLPIPTIAAVDGLCTGVGVALACACDLRIASLSARFGVLIGRTLGAALSNEAIELIRRVVGTAHTRDLLLTGRLLSSHEAWEKGLVTTVAADLDQQLLDTVDLLQRGASLAMAATKESIRRLESAQADPSNADLLRTVYDSEDFADAVAAFQRGENPVWRGR